MTFQTNMIMKKNIKILATAKVQAFPKQISKFFLHNFDILGLNLGRVNYG